MFQSTLSVAIPNLRRSSTFSFGRQESQPPGTGLPSHLASLSPALVDDLKRFERNGIQTELIEVVAASMRHGRDLRVQLEYGHHALPLTLFPTRRLMHAPLPQQELLSLCLADLFVLNVGPAAMKAPGSKVHLAPAEAELYASLGPLSWELALRGARSELLPEIPAHAAYRIPPGVALQGLDLNGTLAAAVHRLQRESTNLKDLASWAGFDRERATRLLNGLYLQSALMATLTHPAANSDVFN